MKAFIRRIAILLTGVFAAFFCYGQVVISSFTKSDGQLAWTNSTSATNYTYRIEWASRVEGPWKDFSALTNLSHFQTTNSQGAVNVPTFLRLVWIDPPKPLGLYDFSAYNAAGQLIVIGTLSIDALESGYLSGISDLRRVGVSTDFVIPAFVGVKPFGGTGSTNGESFTLALNRFAVDDQVRISGRLTNSAFSGFWQHQAVRRDMGTFTAVKLP